jgi:hypothetical protein
MDTEGVGNVAGGSAFLQRALGELALVLIHFLGAAKADDAFLSVDESQVFLPFVQAWMMVSAQGSEMDWKRAPASR